MIQSYKEYTFYRDLVCTKRYTYAAQSRLVHKEVAKADCELHSTRFVTYEKGVQELCGCLCNTFVSQARFGCSRYDSVTVPTAFVFSLCSRVYERDD